MSTIIATTLSNGSVSVPTATVVNGSAKVWVNFNGTGTIAARDSFNVASLTDSGTGRYSVNFSTALPDANYAVTSLADGDGYMQINNTSVYSSTAIAVASNNMSNAGIDRTFVSVSISR